MSVFQDMMRKLTDVFNKNPGSNVSKVYLLLSSQIDQLNDTYTRIGDWRDIEQAEGVALDNYGKNFGQLRGTANDEKYRIFIRAKIARDNSDGTTNAMINALALSLNTSPSTIKVQDLWDEFEPAALMIESIPTELLNKAGITTAEFGEFAQDVAAAGVRVYMSTSALNEYIKISGTSYSFPVRFKITNRFRTGGREIGNSASGS